MWSSGTVQDLGSLDREFEPRYANVFVSLGKILSLNCFVDLTHQGGIRRGKYYNLSADKVCTWPVAPLGEAK